MRLAAPAGASFCESGLSTLIDSAARGRAKTQDRRAVKALGAFLLVFIIAWLIAATVDIWPRDQVRVFGMSRQTDRTTGQPTPRWLEAPQAFRIEGQMVLRNVGGLVSRYENCEVFGLKDWSCSYEDGSGWFTMINGRYVVSEFGSDIFPGYEWRTISQFTYHLERCRMWARSNVADALLGCAFGPFSD